MSATLVILVAAATSTMSAEGAILGVAVSQRALPVEPGAVLGQQGLVVVDAAGSDSLSIGDIVLRCEGRRVFTLQDLAAAIGDRPAGARVRLLIQREGEEMQVEERLVHRNAAPLPRAIQPVKETQNFVPPGRMTFAKDPSPTWYGWQIIPFDLLAIGLAAGAGYTGGTAGTILLGTAIAAYAGPSPIIHLMHNNEQNALYSLGARVLMPAIIAGVGGGDFMTTRRSSDGTTDVQIGPASIIAMAIMAVAMVVDSSVLAFETPKRRNFDW